MESSLVTFQYRASKTRQLKHCTLSAEKFIHRFLQHVLPRGFVKIRYFGFFGATLRPRLLSLRKQLEQELLIEFDQLSTGYRLRIDNFQRFSGSQVVS